jgi:DNA mismatch repair ATPase MutS
MTNINDIDKIHRRLQVGLIHPTEFCTLLNSYEQIISILKIINETGISLNMICPFEINLAEIIATYDDFSSRLILDSCRNITYNRMRHNIFSVGVNIELDTLAE